MRSGVIISKKLVIINSISTVAARCIQLTVLLWASRYLIQHVDREEFKLVPVVQSIVTLLPLFTSVLTGGCARFLVDAYAKHQYERVTQIASTMFVILLITSLVVVAIGAVFTWHVGDILTILPERVRDAQIMFVLMLLTFACRLPVLPLGTGFLIRQKYTLTSIGLLVGETFNLIVLASLFYFFGPRVIWLTASTALSTMIQLASTTYFSMRLVPELKFRWSAVDFSSARQLISYGGWNSVSILGGFIRERADVMLLNEIATAVDVTSFYFGSIADNQIRRLAVIASTPLLPAVQAMYAINDQRRITNTFIRGGRYALWFSLLAATPLSIFVAEVYDLYLGHASAMLAQTPIVTVILFAQYPWIFATTMTSRLAAASRDIKPFAILIISQHLTNLVLTVFILKYLQMGAIGSALATLIVTVAFYTAILGPFGIRLSQTPTNRFWKELVRPGLLPCLCCAVVCLLIRFTLHPQRLVPVAAACAAGILVYLVVLIVFCTRPDERQSLARLKATLLRPFAKTKHQPSKSIDLSPD